MIASDEEILEGVARSLLSLSNDMKDDWGVGVKQKQAYYMAIRYLGSQVERALAQLRAERKAPK